MKKVVTINLNGQAYQVDEDAFERLRAYLDHAATELRNNPDRDEILADLEQAIADKCQRFLGPQKSVVSAPDVQQLLAEMGPVDAGTGEPQSADDAGNPQAGSEAAAGAATPRNGSAGASRTRRLYRINEGAWMGGVCTGIAAYLHADPTVIRVIWGVLGVLDLSVMRVPVFTLAYLVLWGIIPEAGTSEEHAAASGAAFNAREIIEEAKRHYAASRAGRHHTRWERKLAFKRRLRMRRVPAAWGAGQPAAFAYGARLSAGAFSPFLTFAAVLMFWLMVVAALSLADNRTILNFTLPPDIPLWAGLLGLVMVYHWLAWPLRLARRAGYHALSGTQTGPVEVFDHLAGIAFSALILWFAYTHVDGVRELVERLPDLGQRFLEWTKTFRR